MTCHQNGDCRLRLSSAPAGLAIDLTSTQVQVPNPNPEKGDLPPSPVLVVATSDGQLRFFTLGCTDATLPPTVHPPTPAPPITRAGLAQVPA